MDICIIGGGASGMILASKIHNNKVTIFDSNSKLGKKLLMTGNGKCNFTNGDFSNIDEVYNNDFARAIYNRYDNKSFIDYLESIGVVSKLVMHRELKCYYPNTNKASSVYFCLLDEITNNKHVIINDSTIDKVSFSNNKFTVEANNKKYIFDKVVVATGGMTYPKTGSNGIGYKIAKDFSHNVIKPIPGLCGLKYSDSDLKKIESIRVDAKVKAFIASNDKMLCEEVGEIQFSENFISGIPIFNISRNVARYIDEKQDISIRFDFVFDIDNIKAYLLNRKNNLKYKNTKYFLSGMLPDEISKVILHRANIDDKAVAEFTDKDILSLLNQLTEFKVSICGLNSENAQITLGGVDTSEVNEKNLESKLVPGLYFIGEVLDIDGRCGGYNLQLAYATASIVADDLGN